MNRVGEEHHLEIRVALQPEAGELASRCGRGRLVRSFCGAHAIDLDDEVFGKQLANKRGRGTIDLATLTVEGRGNCISDVGRSCTRSESLPGEGTGALERVVGAGQLVDRDRLVVDRVVDDRGAALAVSMRCRVGHDPPTVVRRWSTSLPTNRGSNTRRT